MDLGNIKNIAKKYPLGTVAAAVLVVMLGVLFLRRSSMTDIKTTLESSTQESERYTTNISYAVQLEDHLHSLEDTNRVIVSRLVNSQALLDNLQYFYKLEAETGVKLLDTRPASTPAVAMKGGYKPVQYAVSLQGSYAHVLTFLRRLEQGNYYCRVVTASCNLAQQDFNNTSSDKKTAPEIVLSLTVEILGKA